jgi:hypothetical protein
LLFATVKGGEKPQPFVGNAKNSLC